MSTTQPIRDINHVRALTNYHLQLGQYRNHQLIVFGLNTALRIGDILPICWQDVYDFCGRSARSNLVVKEQKTGKTKTVALNHKVAQALALTASAANPQDFLFANPHSKQPLTRVQARRIICAAGEALRLPVGISCHSLRKTFGYHAWKTGVSPAVLMEIFNHSSLRHTRRYLGIAQDDLDAVYMGLGW